MTATSEYLNRPTRSESEARSNITMLDTIRAGVKQKPQHRSCPWCGTDPLLAAKIHGRFVVECESDECGEAGREVRAVGSTLEAVWAAWNGRP